MSARISTAFVRLGTRIRPQPHVEAEYLNQGTDKLELWTRILP